MFYRGYVFEGCPVTVSIVGVLPRELGASAGEVKGLRHICRLIFRTALTCITRSLTLAYSFAFGAKRCVNLFMSLAVPGVDAPVCHVLICTHWTCRRLGSCNTDACSGL